MFFKKFLYLKYKYKNHILFFFVLFASLSFFLNICNLQDIKIIKDFEKTINNNRSYNQTDKTTQFKYDKGFYPFDTPISLIWFFTKQSNILIFIIYLLYFFKTKNYDWYIYLVFIGLIDIMMTGMIYHFIINKGSSFVKFYHHPNLKNFLSQLEHTINPIFFLFFYFVYTKKTISYKNIWIALIHPSIYALFFLFYGYFNFIENSFKKQEIKKDPIQYYPYFFFSPFEGKTIPSSDKHKQLKIVEFKYIGYKKTSRYIGILFSLTTFFTYIFLFIKKHFLSEYD
ncbi:conserved hypothetical protein [Candidatus Phytoplasma mali]|uniref:Uncharacterized protein n=1 Tax=Phytoplasma mali (strain AT) TaxID=482235 RepID=B3R0E0_PHYMT|nr:hypothetical protein [Candidatus Phytoplasma mali]CAP18304.1 conserved hypothetical protein [Candidatus Phytoplasma mali]